MYFDKNEIMIIINNSTENLILNNYLNMKKIINDIKNYIKNNDNIDLEEDIIINLIKIYRNNLLLDCYYKNNKINLKERVEWFYNYDYKYFSSSYIQEKDNIKSLNKNLNHYNDQGKFIYNQKPYYYYSALRLDNNNNFLEDIYNLYKKINF